MAQRTPQTPAATPPSTSDLSAPGSEVTIDGHVLRRRGALVDVQLADGTRVTLAPAHLRPRPTQA